MLSRQLICSLALSLAVSSSLLAHPIDRKQATLLAQRFLQQVQPEGARSLSSLQLSEQAHFYIVNQAQPAGGFVLIAKDDSQGALLGYSTSGHFALDSLPEGLRSFFLRYQSPASTASQARAFAFPAPEKLPIAPLVKSKWGQIGIAYNLFTPLVGTQHAPAGCVATAMAQIMALHQWPLQGKGTKTHSHPDIGTIDFSQHTYDWEHMLPSYGERELYYYDALGRRQTRPETEPTFTSLARLMADLGAAVDMRYTATYSGSYSFYAVRAWREHFDYDTSELLSRSTVGTEDFDAFIEQELRQGFPLYISGGGNSGFGHAWVIDGMDRYGLFHMNFGWEGQGDGYFALGKIAPNQLGREFAGQRRPRFSTGIQIIAVHPRKPLVAPIDTLQPALQHRLEMTTGGALRFVKQEQATLTLALQGFKNDYPAPFYGDYGYGLYDQQGGLLRIYPSKYHTRGGFTKKVVGKELLDREGATILEAEEDRLSLERLPDGIYDLRPMSSQRAEDGSWGPWRLFKQAPTLQFELKQGQLSILEESGSAQGIQPLTLPQHGYLTAGKVAQIGLLLKNLTTLEQDVTFTLHLLDASGARLTSSTSTLQVLAPTASALVHFPLALPADLPAGRYRLELEAQGSSSRLAVQRYQRRQDLSIEVSAPLADGLEVLRAQAVDAQGEAISSYPVLDLQSQPEARLRLQLLRPATEATTLTELRTYLIDTQSSERLLCGVTSIEDLRSSATPTFFSSLALKRHLGERLRQGRVYRLAIEGLQGERSYDLWPSTLPAEYLSFYGVSQVASTPTPELLPAQDPASTLPSEEEAPLPPSPQPQPDPEAPTPEITPVDEASLQSPTLRYFAREARLAITGGDLRRLEVYAMTGERLLQRLLPGLTFAELSLQALPHGIYLVRVIQGQGQQTFRLAR